MRPGENQPGPFAEKSSLQEGTLRSVPTYAQPMQPLPESGNLESDSAVSASSVQSALQPTAIVPAPSSLLHLNKWALLATSGVLILIILASVITLWPTGFKANNQSKQPASNYNTGSVALNNVTPDLLLNVAKAAKLNINGELQVGGTVVLAPSTVPTSPKSGQIYYDQLTNTPYVYNGTSFVSLVDSPAVRSLGGATGALTLGNGLQINGSELTLSAAVQQSIGARVTTIQGQSGDVLLLSGNGISVNGTTITNTGVTQVLGSNGLLVTQSGGLATVSLPQLLGISDTPTFGGVQLNNALTIASGGTNTNGGSYASTGVFYYNGSSFATTPTPASNGLCLVSGASGPVFGACSGGSIDDATTTTKGIASFNSSDFSVTAGAVSLAATVTKAGNSFNGSAQLIKLDSGGQASSAGQCLLSTAGGVAFTACPGGGNVSSGATQTPGALTKFDSATNQIVNSIATESGSELTVNGTLLANSLQGSGVGLTNLNANNIASGTLSVARGGTGQVSFAANSILLGNGTAGLGSLTPGSNGDCLVIVAGAPAYSTCTGAGGVSSVNTGTGVLTLQGANGVSVSTAVSGVITITGPTIATGVSSLNGLTGSLSVADASASGNTVTINTATTSGGKGIASFNSANFTISGGVVNTIQGIGTSATPTFGGLSLQAANATLSGVGAGGTTTLQFATQAGNDTKTITIPNTSGTVAVAASGPLSLSADGVLSCVTCLSSGGGGAGGVTSINTLVGTLSIVGANGVTVDATGGDTLTITAPTPATGVTSLNGGNGVLILDNATYGAGHIVIDNASVTTKGIASFSNADFTVTSGAVNLGATITKAGNSFNGLSQLVQLNSSGHLPALNGSSLTNLNASNITSGTLGVVQGGTGLTSYTTGDLLYASNSTTLGKLTAVASGSCLVSAGVGTAPMWGSCGGGVTIAGSPTSGHLAKFNSAGQILDSNLAESGTELTYSGNAVIAAASGFIGNLLDLRMTSTSMFKVDQAGDVTGGKYNTATISGGTLSDVAVNGLGVSSTTITGASGLTISAATSGNQNLILQGSGTGVVQVSSNLSIQGSATVNQSLTIGTASSQGELVLHAGNSFTGTIKVISSLGHNTVYVLPAVSGTIVEICTSAGNCIPNGNTSGDMLYWNGTGWAVIPAGSNGDTLVFCGGIPIWGGNASISTTTATSITYSGAVTGGTITGSCSGITERGVVYSTSPNPTTADTKVTSGSSSNSYAVSLSGLSDPVTYYVRAYIINGTGTVYGNEISFTTVERVYSLGETGPGGGKVFYDKGSYSNGWRYLEAISLGSAAWCSNTTTVISTGAPGDNTVGGGQVRSDAIAPNCSSGALRLAYDYAGGGMTDWYLPNGPEATALYNQSAAAGVSGTTWRSDEYTGSGSGTTAFYTSLLSGTGASSSKASSLGVVAIRTF